VCQIRTDSNQVVIGQNQELFSDSLLADDVNLISVESLENPIRVCAKIRYRHPEQPATAWQDAEGFLHVKFDEPQRAITKGQAVVLYQNDIVVGGGTIL
ncbi:MAG: tRNA 2-thiouridine(34) synthase MnmA, partial [Oscillospiraceae bacterium]|nr:tRNA 2-thiouridine(34) synthase MnmA [Oscillospiraceae bacterium]